LGTVQASLRLIDQLEAEIDSCERELRALGAEHAYITNLMTVPGIGWGLAYAIASEIGDIARFASPKKLCGHTGLCPRVYQSGCKDRCGALATWARSGVNQSSPSRWPAAIRSFSIGSSPAKGSAVVTRAMWKPCDSARSLMAVAFNLTP